MGPRRVVRAAGIVATALSVYVVAIRPWHLRWGATEDEVRESLPGDELVGHPMLAATRAVTIDAAGDVVWPWLVQQGYGRAGWYSYRIDNAGRRSPDRIVPELQHLAVGDVLRTGRTAGFRVTAMEPGRFLLLVMRDARAHISVLQWLAPAGRDAEGRERTRLVQRIRAYVAPSPAGVLFALVADPGDFVFMRKQMLGIKHRAERLAAALEVVPPVDLSAPTGRTPSGPLRAT